MCIVLNWRGNVKNLIKVIVKQIDQFSKFVRDMIYYIEDLMPDRIKTTTTRHTLVKLLEKK